MFVSGGCETLQAQQGGPVPAGAVRSSWLWSTTAEQGWDSNVRYITQDDPDYISRINTALAVVRQGARGSLGLTASGSGILYADLNELNTFTYEFVADGRRRLTPRTSGQAGAFYRTRLSTDVIGTLQLPILGLAFQKSGGGTVSAEHLFSTSTTGRAELGYTYVTFDTPVLVPGGALTARLQSTHRYSRRASYIFGLDVQEGRANGLPLSSQAAVAGWQPRLGSVNLRLIGGVTRFSSGGPAKFLPTGTAEVRDSIGPGTLSAGYTRSVSQAFGIGQLLTTGAATVAYDFQAKRGNFVTLGASMADSKVSSGAGLRFKSRAATAAFRRVLPNGFTFGSGVSYRQREDVTTASGTAAQVQIGYTLGSR